MKKYLPFMMAIILLGGVAIAATTTTTKTATFTLDGAKCTLTCVEEVNIPEPTPEPTPTPTPTPTPGPGPNERTIRVYVTGFSWYDNDPPGSNAIALPVIHNGAGGIGTYEDPITVAVGWTGRSNTYYERGTIFYFPHLKRYGIVEDMCASCTDNWLDIYVDGRTSSNRSADRCMNSITGNYEVIQNPGPDYPVLKGVISQDNQCIF